MIIIRRLGAGALLIAAIAVWFGMAPEDPSNAGDNSAGERSSIELRDDGNNAIAEGAPQQTVVNGWTGNEYLALISEQLDEAPAAEIRDDRAAAMLGLCLGRICLIASTSGAETRRMAAAPTSAPPMPPSPTSPVAG